MDIYIETEITVEFNHCDPMQVVWHGNYINYFETGRRLLLEKIGYDYNDMKESGYAFPITTISVKYINSLRFRDIARIKATLVEYENCLRIEYEIYNATTGVLTTKGVSTQMAIDIKKGESSFVCPKVFTDKVEKLLNNS